MGGDITLSSEYGHGSAFTVTLPQRLKAGEHPDGYKKFASVETPGTKRVLLYETDPLYAKGVSETLEALKVPYTAVSRQSEFFETVRESDYRFILAASSLCEGVRSVLENLSKKPELVIMEDFGSAPRVDGVKTLQRPVYSLPIANVLNNAPDSAGYNDDGDSNSRFIAPEARVLIVDDIETNLIVAKGLLSPYKMTIDTCSSGAEAIHKVQNNKYDVVFMDHMMPEMDGIEATAHIRALGAADGGYYKDLPIIALTANAVSGMREKFTQGGLNDFLAKPIEMSKVHAMLEKWIPREKREKSIAGSSLPEALSIEIEGLDTAYGMSMTGGSVDGYYRALSVFRADALEKIGQIRDTWLGKNMPLYTTYVHALKSASASIGATSVSEAAKALEFAGRSEEFINANTEKFLEDLSRLAESIGGALPNEGGNTGESTVEDWAFLAPELKKLRESLDAMDMLGTDMILKELTSGKLDRRTRDELDAISGLILTSDYDDALNRVEELLRKAPQGD
jgi:CheY-like chemotaxis protein/HPt (histidine-containing phosphotransfer) domain-containing protein